MVFSLKKLLVPFFIMVAVIVLIMTATNCFSQKALKYSALMGGTIHTSVFKPIDYKAVSNNDDELDYSARFQRPSNQPALDNPYSFKDFDKESGKPPFMTTNFKTSEDVIKAYFGILKDASNMADFWGGCGTIGNAMAPYSYAHELYSQNTQAKIPLKEFTNSFNGIGHITLLKMYPAYTPPKTQGNMGYHMFELEAITGPSQKDKVSYNRGGSFFAYYYGLITTEYNPQTGWKIKSIDYLPEDFLCAPWHGWQYSSDMVVEFIYKDWYKLIDKIDNTEQKGNMIYIYASNKTDKYRFDFVRLANGYDKLLHENVFKNGTWEEINLLKDTDQGFKISILNPDFK